MKCFALSAEVGREAGLVAEASPLKAFQNLGFCACLYVVNWQMLVLILGDIDYQWKWPLVTDLKEDFFFSLNKYKGEVKAKAPGCGQNSAETSTFWTAGFSCNYRHFDDGFRVPM